MKQNRLATEKLAGRQPVQDDLPAVARDDKLPSLASREKEYSLRGIVLMNDQRGLSKIPVGGLRQDQVKLRRGQTAEAPRPEPIGEPTGLLASVQVLFGRLCARRGARSFGSMLWRRNV